MHVSLLLSPPNPPRKKGILFILFLGQPTNNIRSKVSPSQEVKSINRSIDLSLEHMASVSPPLPPPVFKIDLSFFLDRKFRIFGERELGCVCDANGFLGDFWVRRGLAGLRKGCLLRHLLRDTPHSGSKVVRGIFSNSLFVCCANFLTFCM